MEEDIKKNILKTGTTIVGIVCTDGIIMAADRQVTMGEIVNQKKTKKVYQINDYLVFAGCGVKGDIQRVPRILCAELRLKELKSKTRPTVKQSANLLFQLAYSGIRQPSVIPQQVGSLLAGFNPDGSVEIYEIEAAGSVSKVEDYSASQGSGMPYVLGLLERQYKKDITVKEGIELAKESIKSSTQRDTASGYGLDIIAITKDGIEKVVEQSITPNFQDDKPENSGSLKNKKKK